MLFHEFCYIEEQTLHYLLKHAGGSSAEGIGVWH